ncbi:MAG: hypothetical protein QOE61_3254 [Micromonosporaceae bacterium]|nr:hypothetical protein [Micromonosporaceae bacterium]
MTAPANQLIAGRVDSTTWYSGVGLIESVDMLIGGVRNQSWVDQTLGGVGTVAETAVWALDPVGALVTAGFGWTVEHVEPLSAALDWLAGDPDQVAANAQTWHNVAAEQAALGADYGSAVRDQLPNWSGPAATAYRDQAGRTLELVTAMSRACDGIAVIVGASGSLVSMVRTLVRDLIGELISILLVRLPLWTAETVGTLGAGTLWVVGHVTALVASPQGGGRHDA